VCFLAKTLNNGMTYCHSTFVFIYIVGSILIFNISKGQCHPFSDFEHHIREAAQLAQAGTSRPLYTDIALLIQSHRDGVTVVWSIRDAPYAEPRKRVHSKLTIVAKPCPAAGAKVAPYS
jgi:hypothetical protein